MFIFKLTPNYNMSLENDIKLVVFDMEGTLLRKAIKSTKGIAASAWTLLADNLGPEALAEEELTKQKWNDGEYKGYVEWMADTIRIHKKYGLTHSFFKQVVDSVEYHPGVVEAFEELRKKEYLTALISGGFKAQADRLQMDLKIDHSFAACEYFWDGEELVHWNLLPCDYEGKRDFMQLIIKEHGLTPQQCAFVGDGPNDVILAEAVKLSIAFNASPKLQEVCTHAINQPEGEEDFRAILKYF